MNGRIARRRARFAGKSLRFDNGFTLAEVIVALALFTIVAVASVSLIVKLVQAGNFTQDRVAAANLARQQIDMIHVQNNVPNQLPTAATAITTTATVGVAPAPTVNYVIITELPACPVTAPRLRNFSVKVSWTGTGGGNRQVRYDSAIAC